MLQAVMTDPGKITFKQIEKPEVRETEVLLNVKRIGVCGSDIHVYHGLHPYTQYPIVQGHEVSGIVSEVGKKVKGINIGEKITITPQITCGDCYSCRNGMENICENLKVMGFQTNGAAQEFFPVPYQNVVKLPDNISFDHAALIEPIAVGIHALEQGGNISGKKVLILGAGTIGNLTAQSAKALGASSVMITDINNYKLDMAKECGIDYAINTDNDDLNQSIISVFGSDRADLILECVGVQRTVDQAIEFARKGTQIVIVGVFKEKPRVDLGLVQDRELKLIGTLMYQKPDFEKAVDLINGNLLQLDKLITHRFKFTQYLDAYHAIENSNGDYLKVMIEVN